MRQILEDEGANEGDLRKELSMNVRRLIELRRTAGIDLRVGISTVLGRTNAALLPRLGRLAVDLGVDWLKIEETYAATPWARRPSEMMSPTSMRGFMEE